MAFSQSNVLITVTVGFLVLVGSVLILHNNRTSTITLETETTGKLLSHSHEVNKDAVTDEGHHVDTVSHTFTVPRDVWVTKIDFKLINAPDATLHHAALSSIDQPNNLCPDTEGKIIVSIGQDQMFKPTVQFPEGYGIFLPRGAKLQLNTMLHNPLPPIGPGDTYLNVSSKMTLHIADDEEAERLTPLTFYPLQLSEHPCKEKLSGVFSVPPNTLGYHFKGTGGRSDTARLVFQSTSTIVSWGAHLHGWEGGKVLILRKNEIEIERFETKRADDDPYRYDTPHYTLKYRIENGDTISIEAVYDNKSDYVTEGAMGHFGMFVAKEQVDP